MPKYFFTAKSQKGKTYSDAREAKDEQMLARTLRQEGYVLISAVEEKLEKKKGLQLDLSAFSFFGQVSLKDKIMFTRNLKVMISAGISLPKALRTLALQAKNRKLKTALAKTSEEIIKGKNFSDTLKQYPEAFSDLFCNMDRVGEESGTLEENLGVLTRQMEREYNLKSKIKEAMVYPAVVIAAMAGIGIMMLIVVVPKLAKTFAELELELPITTRVVIGLGTFLVEKWYLAILILIVSIIFAQTVFKQKKGKKMFDGLILKIPVVSQIVKKTNATYTVRTLSSLITAGVPLVRALEIVAGTLSNYYFKAAITQSIERVKKGEKLSSTLKPYQNLYPLIVIQMIEVGEETGETAKILEKLGDFFEEEVTNATKNLTAVIEPVLMLIIGGVVGFFAVSMVQPMYSMLSGLQ